MYWFVKFNDFLESTNSRILKFQAFASFANFWSQHAPEGTTPVGEVVLNHRRTSAFKPSVQPFLLCSAACLSLRFANCTFTVLRCESRFFRLQIAWTEHRFTPQKFEMDNLARRRKYNFYHMAGRKFSVTRQPITDDRNISRNLLFLTVTERRQAQQKYARGGRWRRCSCQPRPQ